jgi:hypothetical protein
MEAEAVPTEIQYFLSECTCDPRISRSSKWDSQTTTSQFLIKAVQVTVLKVETKGDS